MPQQKRFGELVDPFGGMDDLKERTIRTPLDPDITFSDDPLRMMRCIRFATQLNFYIDDETFEALSRNKERIHIISKERIADELNKILLAPIPSKGFIELDRCGLLPLIFPEFSALQGVDVKTAAHTKTISIIHWKWWIIYPNIPTIYGCAGLPCCTISANPRPSDGNPASDGLSIIITSSAKR